MFEFLVETNAIWSEKPLYYTELLLHNNKAFLKSPHIVAMCDFPYDKIYYLISKKLKVQ